MEKYIKNYISDSIRTKEEILANEKLILEIENSAKAIIEAYKNDRKVLTAGNGGSAGDAQHIAAEFVSKFFIDRKALSAIALTTNTSILTSIGNDFSHELVFARQIEAHGRKGDIFVAISTSGNSKNIIEAIKQAKKQELTIIGLTGENTCEMDSLCDYLIKVPSKITPIIQESHIMISHIICAIVEKELSR